MLTHIVSISYCQAFSMTSFVFMLNICWKSTDFNAWNTMHPIVHSRDAFRSKTSARRGGKITCCWVNYSPVTLPEEALQCELSESRMLRHKSHQHRFICWPPVFKKGEWMCGAVIRSSKDPVQWCRLCMGWLWPVNEEQVFPPGYVVRYSPLSLRFFRQLCHFRPKAPLQHANSNMVKQV